MCSRLSWQLERRVGPRGRSTVFLPLVFIPAGVGAFEALRERASGPMRVGMFFAFLPPVSMMLGLMRWPSVHWELARAWAAAAEGDRLVLAAVFDGLNRYLGNFIGEFLGELSFSVFFVLSGVGLSRHHERPVGSVGGVSPRASWA